jgi:hypothetical protein
MIARSILQIALLAAVMPGCSNSSTGPTYDPQLPTVWAGAVTNPYFPLVPGTVYQYSGQTGAGVETVTTTVLAAPRTVNGVPAIEVHDEVFLDGNLIEDTYDWYAQDTVGNVWYLGEDSKEILNGQVIGTTGSWEWGVSGALPGIQMWADPGAHVSEVYRQEFSRGVAQDLGKVIALNQAVTVPAGSFTGCIKTEDKNELKPNEPLENKIYCPQLGLVSSVDLGDPPLELVSHTP